MKRRNFLKGVVTGAALGGDAIRTIAAPTVEASIPPPKDDFTCEDSNTIAIATGDDFDIVFDDCDTLQFGSTDDCTITFDSQAFEIR
jgi:hypothetical protein